MEESNQVKSTSGQAILEYIILLAIVVSLFVMMVKLLADGNAMQKLKSPLEKTYKYTYQYGHPQARGQKDGGPKNIPQYDKDKEFRIFINPPISQ